MERILILMEAPEYVDAMGAVQSALKHAAHPEALSFGFTLQEYPEGESFEALKALRALWISMAEESLWTEMERLWAGEEYVLMAHQAMRFKPGWDRELLRALQQCRSGQVLTCALTGFLPVPADPLGAVCPVAADAFGRDGTLTFQHGMPMRHADRPAAGPFLHPGFCFAPAGFFRAVAQGDEPLFMRAFRAGWQLYTLHKPVIQLQWDVPVPPETIPMGHDLTDAFDERFGVAFGSRLLSPQSRRGLQEAAYKPPEDYPFTLHMREKWRKFRYRMTHLFTRQKAKIDPLCVSLFTAGMPEETLMWFRQLAGMKNLPLMAYVPALLKRQVVEFLPDVYDLLPHHTMEIPGQRPEELLPLSKAAVLAAARDRLLAPSHYIWIDPDCVRYPVFDGAYLEWEPICQDKIVIAMVGGQPDTSMFCVPQGMVLDLAADLHARTLAILNQRGELPQEQELWNIVLREKPEWFSLIVLPVRGQLFTQICGS